MNELHDFSCIVKEFKTRLLSAYLSVDVTLPLQAKNLCALTLFFIAYAPFDLTFNVLHKPSFEESSEIFPCYKSTLQSFKVRKNLVALFT